MAKSEDLLSDDDKPKRTSGYLFRSLILAHPKSLASLVNTAVNRHGVCQGYTRRLRRVGRLTHSAMSGNSTLFQRDFGADDAQLRQWPLQAC